MAANPFSVPVWQPTSTAAWRQNRADGSTGADVLVIGAGFAGLSTALALARSGKSVIVLEAAQVGQGASGLNGGQVIPGLKYDPEWLTAHFGEAQAAPIIDFVASTADSVFDLTEREQLAVPVVRQGWIYAANTDKAMTLAHERNRQWKARGADVDLLDAAEIQRLTGTQTYVGGWLDRRAGTINPLAFVNELARLATENGALILEGVRVNVLRRGNDRWEAATEKGLFRAPFVVLATNAYTDGLVPDLARSLVPLHSFQLATEPLPEDLGRLVLPHGQAVSDSRRILVYYRKSPDGRLVLGGRGRMGIPRSEEDWNHLHRAMLRLYPFLQNIRIERRWYGRVGMTPDHMPHIHEPEPGLLTLVGCQGRGVGMMTAIGACFARYIETGDRAALPFPVTPIRPIPFHRFRQIGIAAAITSYRLLDALEK